MLFPFVVDVDLLVLMVRMLKILQNVWPVSALLKYDHELKVSHTLVSKPRDTDCTKHFVLALSKPETGEVVYILCVHGLSER